MGPWPSAGPAIVGIMREEAECTMMLRRYYRKESRAEEKRK